MDKSEHGELLRQAVQRRGLSRQTVADHANVKVRTVTNWTTGETMPSEREKDSLRALLGPYDAAGDPVEVAIRNSDLTEDRQLEVLSIYKRALRLQREAG